MDLDYSNQEESIVNMPAKTDKFVAYTLVFIVLISSIPLGANRPWSWSTLSVLVLLLFIVQLLKDIFNSDHSVKIFNEIKYSVFMFTLVIIWSVFQTFIKYDMNHSIIILERVISIDPEKSLQFSSRLISYGMIFWITVKISRNYEIGVNIIKCISIFTTILSLYGLYEYSTGEEKILWMDKNWAFGSLTATFINQNSYATYCSIGILCNIYLIQSNLYEYRKNIMQIVTGENIILLTGIIAGISALILTNSRAGISSGFIGIITIMSLRNFKYLKSVLIIMASFITILIIGQSMLLRIINPGENEYIRFTIYSRIIDMISHNHLFGQGLGSFKYAFMPYRSAELSWLTWDLAHNSYLEVFSDLGIVGGVILLLSIGIIIKRCWVQFRVKRSKHTFMILAISVSVTVSVHSLFDFSLQIPAITALFSMILAIGWIHASPGIKISSKYSNGRIDLIH